MNGLHPQDGDPIPTDPLIEAEHDDTRDDVDQIRQLIRELDLGGGVARIHRRRPGAAQYTYEAEVPVDGFSQEMVRRVHGGGDYAIKLVSRGGKFVRQLKFSIDASHVGEMDRKKEIALPMNNGQDGNMMAFLLKSQEAAEQRAEAATHRAEQSMQLLMTSMMQSQTTLVQLMVGKPQPAAPEPFSRIIEVMAPLLVPVITQAMQPRPSGLGEIGELVKLARDLSPAAPTADAEPKEEDMMDRLSKILQAGAPLVQAFLDRGRSQPQPMAQVNPKPRPVQPAEPTPIPSAQDLERQAAEKALRDLLGQLKMVTPVLVRAASKNSQIESYLDFVDDYLDEQQYQALQMLLQRDDWVDTLFGGDPGVRSNMGWFENFRQMILNPETEVETDDDTPKTDSQGGAQASGPVGVPE